MDSRERYARALTFQSPDRVPIMHHHVNGAFRTHGDRLRELYELYPSDVLLSPDTGGIFSFRDCQRGRWTNETVSYDDWGCGWLWTTPDHMGIAIEHPLADWSALEGFRAPDPMTGDDGVRRMVDAVDDDGHRHFVLVDGGEVFQRMFFLRGFENLLVDLMDDRPEVYALRDLVADFVVRRVERWLETNRVDLILVRDDWGTQSSLMIHPDVWRRVFKPIYKRIIDLIHAGGAHGSFHSDGVISEILPDVVEMGWDEINPQVSAMNLEGLGKQFGGKVCVRADIDRQQILPNGSPEEVRTLIETLFDTFGTFNGGYVGWGEMNADVPIANGEAMLATLHGLRY